MLLCLGSVVWTVASEAHWLPQAETKRQMVVVCVVYCDCDLTALLYLLLEVCVCSCAQLSACLHKQMHLCHDKERDAETLRTQLSLLSLSLLGSCWWISSQSKQESKHSDGSACSYSRYQTMLEFNYSILSFFQCRWKYCYKAEFEFHQTSSFRVFSTCWHRNWNIAHSCEL